MAISISMIQQSAQSGNRPCMLMPRDAFSMHERSHLGESVGGAISSIDPGLTLTGGGRMR
jgi:hypothetical protein